MEFSLSGARVALFESRRSREMASLVTRHGGMPVVVPALVEERASLETRRADAVEPIIREEVDIVICMTGVAVDLLVGAAEATGRGEALIERLRQVPIVVRGPKPAAALRSRGIAPTVAVPEPHTTRDLVAATEPLAIAGKRVLVLTGGDPATGVDVALAQLGARVTQTFLYQWTLPPERRDAVRGFIDQLLAGEIDCVAFTAQVQVRFLFATADAAGLGAAVRSFLRDRVVVAAVGPVCTAALRTEGLETHVEPVHPKMGHMIVALARFITARRGAIITA